MNAPVHYHLPDRDDDVSPEQPSINGEQVALRSTPRAQNSINFLSAAQHAEREEVTAARLLLQQTNDDDLSGQGAKQMMLA